MASVKDRLGLATVFVGLLLLIHPLTFAWWDREPSNHGYVYRENASSHELLAEVHLRNGNVQAAIRAYQEAISLNPESAQTAPLYNNLGKAYEAGGYYQQALVSYQYATQLQPDFEVYYQNLVDLYQKAKQLADAERLLTQIVTKNPNDGWAWFLLALVQLRQATGSQSKAALAGKSLKRFTALEPRSGIRTQICRERPELCQPVEPPRF
jgi:tetratricopeptide (TPR) repeat protein